MAARLQVGRAEDSIGVKGLGRKPTTVSNRQTRRAHETYQQMSCDELELVMERATGEATRQMQAHRESFSEVSARGIQSIALLTVQVSAVADAADRKLCLPEVIDAGQTSENMEHFRSSESTFVNAASSEEARNRFRRAFSRMAVVQANLAGLHSQVLNRHVLFPQNIEEPAVCPSPCTGCTRDHNSWFQEAETFAFKCILDAGASKPEGEGFKCEEPTARNSNASEQKAWCEVHHWQMAAAQTLDISAKAACGARSILAPLQHGGDMSEVAAAACEKEMRQEALSQEEVNELRRLDSVIDEVVSPGNLAMFSLFLIFELITTVSELRLRSRSPSSPREADQSASILMETHAQGSAGCQRAILTLANGLFGAMMQIVLGIAFLAMMGTLGLLAAMSVFGADAVVATIAPFVGLGFVAPAVDTLGAVRGSIVEFLERFRGSQAALEEGAQGAIAAGASVSDAAALSAASDATASLSGTASQAGGTLEAIVEALDSFADQIMSYWPAIAAGGLTILAVGFGIWGLVRLWHSVKAIRCLSGYARVGAQVVCHPDLAAGEVHQVPCPGEDDSEHLTFWCSSSNGGITTWLNVCSAQESAGWVRDSMQSARSGLEQVFSFR